MGCQWGKEEKTMKYRVLMEQDEDGVFVVEVPTFPGAFLRGKPELKR